MNFYTSASAMAAGAYRALGFVFDPPVFRRHSRKPERRVFCSVLFFLSWGDDSERGVVSQPFLEDFWLGYPFWVREFPPNSGLNPISHLWTVPTFGGGLIEKEWTGGKKIREWFFKEVLEWAALFIVSQVTLCALWPYIGVDYFHHLPRCLPVRGNLYGAEGFCLEGK